jgi:hypothetical protein
MKITGVWPISILLVLLATADVAGLIQPGDKREQVIEELGEPPSRMKFGAFETLDYQDGTRISLKEGVVTEVKGRNQTTGARLLKPDTNGLATSQSPRSSPRPMESVAPHRSTNAPAAMTNTGRFSTVVNFSHGLAASAIWTNQVKSLEDLAALTPQLNQWAARFGWVFGGVGAFVYLLSCYCYQRICQKAQVPAGALVWIPVLQFIPLFRVAHLSAWLLLLLIIPGVNIFVFLLLWAGICVSLRRSPWLAAVFLIPILNLGLIPYLAFSGPSGRRAEQKGLAADARRQQPVSG